MATTEAGRLKVAKGLREAEAFQREFLAFQRRITESGNNAFEGVGEHDDLVIAVALACWWPIVRKTENGNTGRKPRENPRGAYV